MRGDRRRRPRGPSRDQSTGTCPLPHAGWSPRAGGSRRPSYRSWHHGDNSGGARLSPRVPHPRRRRPARCPSDDGRRGTGRPSGSRLPAMPGRRDGQTTFATALPVGADAAAAPPIPRQGSSSEAGASCSSLSRATASPSSSARPAASEALLARLAGERSFRGVVGLSRGGAPPLDLTSRRPSRVPPPTSPARAASCGSWSTRPGSSTAAGSGPRGAGASSTPRTWRRPSPSTPPVRRC